MTRKHGLVLLILLSAIVLGALREFLFVNLNYQIDHMQRHTEFSYAHSIFQAWTTDVSLGALTKLKWFLSASFIGATLLMCILLAQVLFNDHRYRSALVVFFCSIACLAMALHFIGNDTPALEVISVKFLHLLQYPGVLLVLIVASFLKRPA